MNATVDRERWTEGQEDRDKVMTETHFIEDNI